MLTFSPLNNLVAHPETQRPSLPDGDLWVFAYGSLLWNPGFKYKQRRTARLFGYHRSLCVWSHVHRGTPERPGMVLGLDRGGSCRGALYRIDQEHKALVAEYLYAREMPTRIYRAAVLTAQTDDGARIPALCFIVNRQDKQYAGRVSPNVAAHCVAGASGLSGSSADYLRQTLIHLKDLGIKDHRLQAIERGLSVLETA